MLSFIQKLMTFIKNLFQELHRELEEELAKQDGVQSSQSVNEPPVVVKEEQAMASAELEVPANVETPSTEIQVQEADTDITPQEFIRSEVNLLNLPFFALWDKDVYKRMKTEYKAVITRGEEKLEVAWTVAAHQDYGYPGPFDKRVHKTIEQIISQMKSPITNPIPLGSFYHIGKMLGLPHSGIVNRRIKASIERLVATTVISKGTFYHKEGKNYIDRTFHLYDSALFVGQTLKDGGEADINYVYLSNWYLDNINGRYVKPLDYTYYRSLKSPIATRLYELLGVKFYGRKAPYIRYKYSTLCQLLPVVKQRYASKAKENLKAAHTELLDTEFLTGVDWQEIPSQNRDWYIKYYPGKRVGEEIQRFRQKPALHIPEKPDDDVTEIEEYPDLYIPDEEDEENPDTELTPAPVARQPEQRRRKRSQQAKPELTDTQQELLQHMEKLGVTSSVAQSLIGSCESQFIRDWITVVLDKPDEEFTEGRPAYLVKALRENWQLPDTFYRKQAEQEEAERQEQERQLRDNCTICESRGVYYYQKDEVSRVAVICHHTGEKKTTPSTQNIDTNAVWQQTLEDLSRDLPGWIYESYVKTSMLLGIDENTAIIQVPSEPAIFQINRWEGAIAQALTDVLDQEVSIKFISAPSQNPA